MTVYFPIEGIAPNKMRWPTEVFFCSWVVNNRKNKRIEQTCGLTSQHVGPELILVPFKSFLLRTSIYGGSRLCQVVWQTTKSLSHTHERATGVVLRSAYSVG